ncbi:MAG: YggT family protein [Chitinivibrionales bacterium]|nr:YggT family protein [Chitinivibrionales bacterium]
MAIVLFLVKLYQIILIVRVVLSWVPHTTMNPIIGLIYKLTEPVLDPIRRYLPRNQWGIDFAPLVVFLLLWILESMIIRV